MSKFLILDVIGVLGRLVDASTDGFEILVIGIEFWIGLLLFLWYVFCWCCLLEDLFFLEFFLCLFCLFGLFFVFFDFFFEGGGGGGVVVVVVVFFFIVVFKLIFGGVWVFYLFYVGVLGVVVVLVGLCVIFVVVIVVFWVAFGDLFWGFFLGNLLLLFKIEV